MHVQHAARIEPAPHLDIEEFRERGCNRVRYRQEDARIITKVDPTERRAVLHRELHQSFRLEQRVIDDQTGLAAGKAHGLKARSSIENRSSRHVGNAPRGPGAAAARRRRPKRSSPEMSPCAA
jgi:hypothetical protein